MNKKHIRLGLVVVALSALFGGCATAPKENTVYVPVTRSNAIPEVRERGIVKEYSVGRIRDKENPAILHEKRTVYEVAKEPSFEIARNPLPDPTKQAFLQEELEAKLIAMEDERRLIKATLTHLVQTNTALAKGTSRNAQTILLIEAKLAELSSLLEGAVREVQATKESTDNTSASSGNTSSGEAEDVVSNAMNDQNPL